VYDLTVNIQQMLSITGTCIMQIYTKYRILSYILTIQHSKKWY